MSIGLIIFLGMLIAGLMVMALTRSQWSDELTRLGKHSARLSARASETVEEDIFLKQKDDYLSRILAQAGMEARYDQMRVQWICTAIITGALFALAIYLCPGGAAFSVIGLILGVPLGAGGYIMYLNNLAKARQDKMTAQLPQILETMVSTLRAGSPVIEVFKVLAETAPDPIRGEFKRGLISLQLGKSFRDVMSEMCIRIKTPDFKLLTQAIFISQDVGGNLAEVVSTIAEAIRERFKLRDFMNALTAQGKATAIFIGCLPYAITGITYAMCPSYMGPFFQNGIALAIVIVLVLWECCGFYILIKMTTFEV